MLVLILSSYLLFQNVYATYKALKPPKPSRKAKNGADPTAKAKHARKRELKGMLACWIVWSCWTGAETVADRTVAVLTPFYSEIKMFLLLFLIVGRSTMAEPILLHVIRPLVKPYYVPLDSFVFVFTSAADLVVLLFSSPLVWIKIVTNHAWRFLRKTFSSSASLPRPGSHAVSASDGDESLNEPKNPIESTDSTKAKQPEPEPDPLQRFVPKTRGALAQPESDEEDILYRNPLRDEPPPYGVPMDMPVSRERSFPPVFSTPRRATSRVRGEATPFGMGTPDYRPPFDTSMATTASYRPDSDVSASFALSPDSSREITHGAGDLAPDPDVPAFILASPEHPPVVAPAAPAVPSYLQPRTRASRVNLAPARQRVDSYADRPNPRASEFLQGERGMTFADKPKETKGLTQDLGVGASYPAGPVPYPTGPVSYPAGPASYPTGPVSYPVAPSPPGYNPISPPMLPASLPAGFNSQYPRGRPQPPTRPYVPIVPVEDGYESPRSQAGTTTDFIQGWRQRSAIPVDTKPKRNGPAGYAYQPATGPGMPTPICCAVGHISCNEHGSAVPCSLYRSIIPGTFDSSLSYTIAKHIQHFCTPHTHLPVPTSRFLPTSCCSSPSCFSPTAHLASSPSTHDWPSAPIKHYPLPPTHCNNRNGSWNAPPSAFHTRVARASLGAQRRQQCGRGRTIGRGRAACN
ncbi:TB2/DP1, HVA22 family protein [Rhizoctonia solani AG-3 Rhs1AP]|uniref:TB2/DP1, HVA22 family protein n=1 Tax=Rhizoctonia solani AG-3 Rhs1AP TaxID=1086054 RepID=X8JRR9_9AGAM|nr:TB2/DP1, HVA22 family protein [Rhizoctonia solani AG-3 Rhs1AP]